MPRTSLNDRQLAVLAAAAKDPSDLFYDRGRDVYYCGNLGIVSASARALHRRRFIVLDVANGESTLLPKLAGDDRWLYTVILTKAGWAAARRQLSAEDTRELLGTVPPR